MTRTVFEPHLPDRHRAHKAPRLGRRGKPVCRCRITRRALPSAGGDMWYRAESARVAGLFVGIEPEHPVAERRTLKSRLHRRRFSRRCILDPKTAAVFFQFVEGDPAGTVAAHEFDGGMAVFRDNDLFAVPGDGNLFGKGRFRVAQTDFHGVSFLLPVSFPILSTRAFVNSRSPFNKKQRYKYLR